MSSCWQSKPTVQKGNIGEAIIRQFLEGKGFVVYEPETEGAHPFDKLVVSKDKKRIFIAEVKTKARRTYYPDTGIDIRHYNDYQYVQQTYSMDVFIFFVDEFEKRVYGNFLSKLAGERDIEHNGRMLHYPLENNGIIYFPLACMSTVATITETQAMELKAKSNRSYDYEASR